MSAYDGVTWGSGEKAQIGIKVSTTNTSETITTVRMDIYFRSKWSVRDSVNNFYYQFYEGGKSSIGSVNIQHSVDSPSWSESNITYVGYRTGGFARTKSQQTGTCKAWYDTIEAVNSGSVSANFTVPAKPSYTVSYNANGGSGAPNSQTKWYGENLTLSSTKPTRTGHNFVGWGTSSTDTTADYQAGGTYSSNSAITLYAIWQKHTYTVTYNANGGSGAPGNQTKTYGDNLTLSSVIPTRKDYNFLGWNTYQSATEPLYSAGGTYSDNSAVTLYAVWEVAYIKPRLSNYYAYRCDSSGNAKEDGTNVKVVCEYEADYSTITYRPYYKATDEGEGEYVTGKLYSKDTASGTLEFIIENSSGKVAFSTDKSFDIRLNVSDQYGYSQINMLVYSMFIPIDFSPNGSNVSFGESAPDESEDEGLLRLAFTNVDLAPKNRLLYKGEVMFGQNELWSGKYLMNETHSITLKKKVSETKNGLLLVFTRNDDYNVISYFVPKQTVVSYGRTGWCFPMCTAKFDYIGSKTIYIGNELLEGHTDNDATGTNSISGITYHNEQFYLRYVYSV